MIQRSDPAPDQRILAVRDLSVTFGSGDRTVHAVNGISYDLCARHADRLSPPRGWTGHDHRDSASPGMSTSVAS